MHFHSCFGVAELFETIFRNNTNLLLTFDVYIDDIAVCRVICPRMNEIYAKHVPDSDGAV